MSPTFAALLPKLPRLLVLGLIALPTAAAAQPPHSDPLPPEAIGRVGSTRYRARDSLIRAAYTADGKDIIWDVYGKHQPAAPEKWSAAEGERLWEELAGPDAKVAFQAIRRLVRNAGPAVALVRAHLKPVESIDARRLKDWLHELDSDEFTTRQEAVAELEKLGDRIAAPLQEARANAGSLEAKRRLDALLAEHATPTAARRARWRALEALEQIATVDAVQLLQVLGQGEPAARLTRDAAATLDRVRQRPQ